jgi:hypothetical protein
MVAVVSIRRLSLSVTWSRSCPPRRVDGAGMRLKMLDPEWPKATGCAKGRETCVPRE